MMSKKSPQLRFEGFTDDWEERKLGEVSKYSNGGSYENDVVENGTYELITLKSVNMSGKLVSSGKFINRETKTLEKDTLVMILSEQSPGLLGMTAKIPENNRYVLNQRVAEIKPNTNIDSYFLSMSINRSQAYFSKRGAGTKVQNISKPNVENFEFYCPSEREQQKIGSFFKQLDDTIALHQRKLDLLKEQKKGFLQKMFPKNGAKVPELRFAGFADDWEERKLIEVADYRNGKAHEKDISEAGDYIVVNSKFVSTNGLVKKYSDEMIAPLSKNEIAFVLSDVPNGRAIARTFLISEENKYSLNQRIAGITPHADTNSYFLHSLMNRNHYFLRFDDGVSQTNLSKREVEKWVELYPSYGEQQKIGSFFKQLDDTITLHQRKLDLLKEQKKGFLQKMFV
ncbi:restriction endonuclease subunit S [Lactococcus lactis]|uniref:restriction endonuclease subunit S n=1 Tax=Lactococcus lactis TaxID=1358 RepID=UPI0035A6AD1E